MSLYRRDWSRVETLCREYGVDPAVLLTWAEDVVLRDMRIVDLRRLLRQLNPDRTWCTSTHPPRSQP